MKNDTFEDMNMIFVKMKKNDTFEGDMNRIYKTHITLVLKITFFLFHHL